MHVTDWTSLYWISCTYTYCMHVHVLPQRRQAMQGTVYFHSVHVYMYSWRNQFESACTHTRPLPCINFKDSACPAELPRWLSWWSVRLARRTLRVRIPPEAAHFFSREKKGVVFGRSCLLHLVSLNEFTCIPAWKPVVMSLSPVWGGSVFYTGFLGCMSLPMQVNTLY